MSFSVKKYAMLTVLWFITLATLGCGSYALKSPKLGVSRQFPSSIVGKMSRHNEYNFERLSKDRGLFVFSYRIVGAYDDSKADAKDKTLSGLRIWEQKFGRSDGEIVGKVEMIPLVVETKPGLVAVRTEAVGIALFRYHRNAIVYGGRYVVDVTWETPRITVEQHFDEDCSELIDYLKVRGVDTTIFPDPIRLPHR